MPSLPPLRPLLDFFNKRNRTPRQDRIADVLVGEIGRATSLLDVGCGAGRVTRAVADRVGASKVVGVDVVKWSDTFIDVELYDGVRLPFPDQSFEAVTIVDVLHHCQEPLDVLKECIRVAKRLVVVKDHFAFGWLSDKVLLSMDRFGNAEEGVPILGKWLHPSDWITMVNDAGARIVSLKWPLPMHGLPWSLVARPELQFASAILPLR